MIVNITAAKGIYACISQYYFLSHQRVSFHLNAKRHIALLSFCPNGRSLILILFAFKLSMLIKALRFTHLKSRVLRAMKWLNTALHGPVA